MRPTRPGRLRDELDIAILLYVYGPRRVVENELIDKEDTPDEGTQLLEDPNTEEEWLTTESSCAELPLS